MDLKLPQTLNVNVTVGFNNHQLERIFAMVEKTVSDWKTTTDALIEKITQGNAGDPETKAAVEDLKNQVSTLAANAATDESSIAAEGSSITEIQDTVSLLVNKLQQGDTAGAMQAAGTLQQALGAVTTSDNSTVNVANAGTTAV